MKMLLSMKAIYEFRLRRQISILLAVLYLTAAACSVPPLSMMPSLYTEVSVPSDHGWPPPGWMLQSPRSTSAWNTATFVDAQTGWLMGTDGAILATKDGGHTWQQQPSRTDRHLMAATFVNKWEGWVVGEGAVVLHTENGGATWVRQDHFVGLDVQDTPLEYLTLWNVAFTDSTHGWITGSGWVRQVINGGAIQYDGGHAKSLIFITEDGGRTWHVKEWTRDQGYLYKTSTGKAGFFQFQPFPNDAGAVHAVLPEARRVWAIHQGPGGTKVVSDSTDGGQTWRLLSRTGFSRMCMTTEKSGWGIGNYGLIVHTQDGGVTWQGQKGGVRSNLEELVCLDERTAMIFGSYGLVLKTTDGGEHWISIINATVQDLRAVAAVDTQHAWAVGAKGTIVATVNGGELWQSQLSGTEHDLEGVTFVSSTHGWAVGDKGTILATVDGGTTWVKQNSWLEESFRSVAFVSQNQGWVIGQTGGVLTTEDGGQTWEMLNRGHSGPALFAGKTSFTAVTFLDAERGWVVGGDGVIYRTRDGGHSWEQQFGDKSGSMLSLLDVSFPTRDHGWVVGFQPFSHGYSIIMSTDNGGRSWEFQSGGTRRSGYVGTLMGVKFVNKKVGWAVGTRGSILNTTNGGRTWTRRLPKREDPRHLYDFKYGPDLQAVTFVDAKTGWVVGNNGTILHTTTGGE